MLIDVRGKGRKKERKINISVRKKQGLVSFSMGPHQGLNPQPRYVS